MTAPTFCLAVPHTPWVPARVESIERLKGGLFGYYEGNSHERCAIAPGTWGDGSGRVLSATDALGCDFYKTFTDREPNIVWSQKLFRWALATGATHLIQLQDDALVAPRFWPILRAMVAAQPDHIIGLEATHPLVPVQHRAGRRWYRDHWLIGVGYVFPRSLLVEYVAWCDANPERVAKTNEDSLISEWSYETKRPVWHPVPTCIDHDIGVPSTYGNDGHHEFSMYRRPLVTWREVDTPALEDPAYWSCTEEGAPLLPGPGTQLCWYCAINQTKFTSPKTGARMCMQCIADMLGHILSRFA